MRVEFINPFLEAADEVLIQLIQLKTIRGRLALKMPNQPYPEICIVLGVVGKVEGQVIYGMQDDCARKIASRMMMGLPVESLDDMAKSALAELGNMVTGRASIGLESAGYPCDISPPTLITAKNITVSSPSTQILVVPLETELGIIDLHVGLEESRGDKRRR
ncbi:MAG TPA: chemotaxis protein CheX [bacterium]|nr:chemotaxis protein CheX [bacterium]HQO34287.1 chemotaxis protein CheX [bacterium]HQP98459.1 chemotaxis protein CheX [bacterium]